MGDSRPLAGRLALDLMSAHLPEIERAQTVADARAMLAQPIAEARAMFTQATKQADTSVLEQSIDELLARLVVLRRPRIGGNGLIYDAGEASGVGRTWVIAIGVAIAIAAAALFLLGR